MQITARIELDAMDVAAAIRDHIFRTTGRDVIGEVEVQRERGIARYSVPTAYDVGSDTRDQKEA